MMEMNSANRVKLGLPLQNSLCHDAIHLTRDINQLAEHLPCQCHDFLMGEIWLIGKNTRFLVVPPPLWQKQYIEVQFSQNHRKA